MLLWTKRSVLVLSMSLITTVSGAACPSLALVVDDYYVPYDDEFFISEVARRRSEAGEYIPYRDVIQAETIKANLPRLLREEGASRVRHARYPSPFPTWSSDRKFLYELKWRLFETGYLGDHLQELRRYSHSYDMVIKYEVIKMAQTYRGRLELKDKTGFDGASALFITEVLSIVK